jgi:hypothetical protein
MKRDVPMIPRLPEPSNPAGPTPQEALVTDTRAGLTPAQMVERKLVSLLSSTPMPVSQLQATRAPSRAL